MGCVKTSKEAEEAEKQLQGLRDVQADCRRLVDTVEARMSCVSNAPTAQEVRHRLERMEKQVIRLKKESSWYLKRKDGPLQDTVDGKLVAMETDARERLAEIRKELTSLRSLSS